MLTSNLTGLISPAGGVALLVRGQDLFLGGKASERDLPAGRRVPVQPDQGDVKLHRGHRGILEALVAIDARHVEAAFARLCVGQVVFAEAHPPTLQLIGIAGQGIGRGINHNDSQFTATAS